MSNEWTIRPNESGGYTILDENGDVAGDYLDAKTAALHHAISLRERRSMSAALETCRTEHPADDAATVTLKWFATLHGEWFVDIKDARHLDLGDTFGLYFVMDGRVELFAESPQRGSSSYTYSRVFKTRGDVRRLCAAMGVELKQGDGT